MVEMLTRADGLGSAIRKSGSGPTVVVLPGGPGADPDYLEDLGGLDRSFCLVVLESRGTGSSDPPPEVLGYAFDRQADDVERLIRHLGLGPTVVLAHSAGCATALVWAARQPEQVAGLVLVTPPRLLDLEAEVDVPRIVSRRADEAWHRGAADALVRLSQGPDPGDVPGLLEAIAPLGYARWGEREQAHARLMQPADPVIPRAFWQVESDAREVADALDRLRVPTLVVTGRLDAAVGVAPGRAWAVRLGGTHVDLPGVAHIPWVDDPAVFVEVVAPFLRTVTGETQ